MPLQLKEIDRGIYVALENTAIAMGLYPDVTTMILADNKVDQSLFDPALQSIIDSGKTVAYIYGASAPKDRLENHYIDFYVNRQYFQASNKGYDNIYNTVDNPNDPVEDQTYTKRRLKDRYVDIQYKIRYVANSAQSHRDAEMIMYRAFGVEGYFKAIGDQRVVINTQDILIQENGVPVDIESGDVIERLYRYLVKEVVIYEGDVIETGIATTVEINGAIAPKKSEEDFDNTDDDINLIVEKK